MPIQIKFNAGISKEESSIQATGEFSHPAGSDGAQILNLVLGGGARFAILAWFNQIFKPYEAVALRYEDLMVNHKVIDSQVTDFNFENLILTQQTLKNSSSRKATYNVALDVAEVLGTSSSWSWNLGVEVSQSISYGMSFLGSGVEGETSFSFSAGFGSTETHYKDMQLSSSSSASIELNPGESAVVSLSGSKGVVTGVVNYEISLSGSLGVALKRNGKWYKNSKPISEVIQAIDPSKFGGDKITNSGKVSQHIMQDNFFHLVTEVGNGSSALTEEALMEANTGSLQNGMRELVF